MGLLDNALQRESTKVVIVSNCSNSEGKLARFPMENDHRDARTAQPKYKRRSVSAVREFPPGCGRHVPTISLVKDEAVFISTIKNSGDLMINGDAEGDCLLSRSGIDSQPPKILENLGPSTVPEHVNHAESKVEDHLIVPGNGIVESRQAKTSEDLASTVIPEQSDCFESNIEAPAIPSELENLNPVDIEPVKVSFPGGPYSSSTSEDIEELKSLEHETIDVPCRLHKKDVPARNNIFPPKYPPRRKVSAVRDFPPLCGRNAAPLIDGKSLGQELMQIKDAQNEDNIPKKMRDKIQNGDAESEGLTIKNRRYQDEVGAYSKNKMGMTRPDLLEQSSNTLQERVQNQCKLETQAAHESGKRNIRVSEDIEGSEIVSTPLVVGLMAAGTGRWMEKKKVHTLNELSGSTSESKQANDNILHKFHKTYVKAKKTDAENYGRVRMKEKKKKIKNSSGAEDEPEPVAESHNSQLVRRSQSIDVTLPPSFIRSSANSDGNGGGVTRSKVRETLRLFQAVFRKVVKEGETNSKNVKRPDLEAAGILKDKGKFINLEKIVGPVPGVEVGDEFQYRVELNVIGLHRQIQGGIDFVKHNGLVIATSIVASGGYDDNMDDSDVLIYTGSGGNVMNGKKEPEDQKLERGNLALKNSVDAKNAVRVTRGDMRASESSSAKKMTYVYDGLYMVEKCWQELGPHNKLIYKFKLVRLPGQPELAVKVVKKCKKFKVREGLCMDDISKGKEVIPICAVNTIDDEKPPSFKYITCVIYPEGLLPVPSRGCNCTNGCSETGNCSCVAKNGGGIPYNRNGAIVEAKALVYECGPSCKCPPSCSNRVSQHGIKFQLEIFKTESRGWGVRSLNSISSGSFICEYIGELLEDKEAEERKGNDEYLFDIGNGNNDNSLWDGLSNLISETHQSSCEILEESGFTIDAAKYGNVGRFINHSCSPNLYAQNVLYDHDDKRVPHIMFFAAENIPPLQELTYHYNYIIDQVVDSDGRIKKKICYCGSSECTGRLY